MSESNADDEISAPAPEPEISELCWKELCQHAPDYLVVIDAEYRRRWVNRLHPSLTMEEVIGQPLGMFLTPETAALATEAVRRALETRQEQTFVADAVVDGSAQWYEVRVVALEGREDLALMSTRDITAYRTTLRALQHSESIARSVIERYPDLIFVMDADGVVINANHGLARSLGTTVEELVGTNVFERMTPDVAARRRTWAKEVMEVGEPRRELDHHHGRTFDSVGYPVRSADGTVIGVAVISRDITEQLRAEEERQERQARRWHSEKMEALGTLASGIAHDFNNLLTSILANAELANRPGMDERRRSQLLGSVSAAATRAANLVKQILAHGTADDTEVADVNVAVAVDEVIGLLRATMPANIELEAELSPQPLYVRANPSRLQQVVMNLCINAAQAMKQGGVVQVRVDSVEMCDDDGMVPGTFVRMQVQDTGEGIAEEVKPRIFEPFYSTKEPDRGSGLGLFVVHGVVTALGGSISVDSEVGRGTTFTLLLPTPASMPKVKPVLGPDQEPRARSCRVLLLDDEPSVRHVASAALEMEGHHVVAVARCSDALAAFRERPTEFDMVIVDQRLRDGAGSAVAFSMREQRPELPIVLCSGHVTSAMREACQRRNVHVLPKPYNLNQLIHCVATLTST